jgi:hypothetical protein
LTFTPERTYENRTYSLDIGYFLRESVTFTFSFQFAVDGAKQVAIALGPEFYLTKDTFVLPYLSGQYMYTMLPNGNSGWKITSGVEKNLYPLLGIDNIHVRLATGVYQIFEDPDARWAWEIIKLGFVFAI